MVKSGSVSPINQEIPISINTRTPKANAKPMVRALGC